MVVLTKFDIGMLITHGGLLLGLWQLWRQNKRNHDENVKRIKLQEYRASLMWTDFCQRHGIDGKANGKETPEPQ